MYNATMNKLRVSKTVFFYVTGRYTVHAWFSSIITKIVVSLQGDVLRIALRTWVTVVYLMDYMLTTKDDDKLLILLCAKDPTVR